MYKIIIVGSGWYGLHCYMTLSKFFANSELDIKILEKNTDIFNNSSNYNQNRLHLGYHYPRSDKTRKLCVHGYSRFIDSYREVVDFIDNNYYLISKDSIVDYDTFLKIYGDNIHYDHTIINPLTFKNIDGNIINTKEKVINSNRAKSYFKQHINTDDLRTNYKVSSIEHKDDKIVINDDITCDILIDCTYNQLQLSTEKYVYEQTISLVYTRTNHSLRFDSLTVMDGQFFSLFPRDISKKLYTLTHVKYTPLIKSMDIRDVISYKVTPLILENVKRKMEKDVMTYYPEFNDHFEYCDYFTSYKCKLLRNTDTRECVIEEHNNVVNVNCGKITGIFDFEDYIIPYVKDFINRHASED